MSYLGRQQVATKTADLNVFEGTTSGRTLWIPSLDSVSHFSASIAPNTQLGGTEARIAVNVKLEVFKGAVWSGSVPTSGTWSGGSWTTLWQQNLFAWFGNTATAAVGIQGRGDSFSHEFDPPLETFLRPLNKGASHLVAVPNTHNAAETAGEYDLRAYFTVIDASGFSSAFNGTINCGVCRVG